MIADTEQNKASNKSRFAETHAYVSAYLPPELERRARFLAAKLRVSRGEIIRRAVQEYLDRNDPQE